MAGVKKRAGRNIAKVVRLMEKDITLMSRQKFWDDYFGKKGSGISNKSNFYIIQPIRERLFRYGVDGKNRKLQPYTPSTVVRRKAKRKPTNRTTLRFSGDWYKSFYVYNEVNGSRGNVSIEVRTRDGAPSESGGKTISEKTTYLKNKYSGEILTLTNEEEKKLIADMEREVFKMFDYDFSTLELVIK